MNRLSVGSPSEPVLDEDAVAFYARISDAIGTGLDPSKDALVIGAPPWSSRNSAQYARVCDCDTNRRVCLKRCSDSSEFLRRELLIPQAKVVLGFTGYNVISSHGVLLRNPDTGKNCALLAGWEDKDLLLLDYGNPKVVESMATLQPGSIADLPQFCHSFGRWCSFDYLLGVRDRNPGNFVYFKDTGILHSVDNEEGPFSTDGRFIGVDDILIQTKQNIDRFASGNNRAELLRQVRLGFIEAWHSISSGTSLLKMLNERELELLTSLLKQDPMKKSEIYA